MNIKDINIYGTALFARHRESDSFRAVIVSVPDNVNLTSYAVCEKVAHQVLELIRRGRVRNVDIDRITHIVIGHGEWGNMSDFPYKGEWTFPFYIHEDGSIRLKRRREMKKPGRRR